jgi:hypothetical protein
MLQCLLVASFSSNCMCACPHSSHSHLSCNTRALIHRLPSSPPPPLCKQFDVNTEYMGRLRGEQLSRFRRLSGWEQRLKVMRTALQVKDMSVDQLVA